MADNVTVDNAGLTDYTAATDKVTYSGDTADVQLMRPVHVTGAEGSRTVDAITTADGQFVQGSIAHDTADSGNPVKIGGKVTAGMPTPVADGDRVNGWWTTDGALVVAGQDGSGSIALLTDSAGALQVASIGSTVSVDIPSALPIGDNNIGNVDVVTLPALPAGSANIGDVDVLTVPADPFGANADAASATGSISAKLRGIATALGITALDLGSGTGGTRTLRTFTDTAQFVGDSGNKTTATQRIVIATDQPQLTNALKVDGSATTQPVSGTITASNTAGDVAHGTGDSGNPVKVGMKAANAFPTAEANNDRVNAIGDLWGRQMVTHIDPAQQVWKSYNDTASRAAGSAQVVWDPTGGKKIAVTSFVVSAYGTTAGRIFLFFADDADLTYTAGTDQPLLVASYAPSTTSKPGTVWTSGQTPIFCLTADRRLHYQNDAAISVDIVIYGYEW